MELNRDKSLTFTIDKDPEAFDKCFRVTRELMERVREAENQMLLHDVEANTVLVNGHKYGMLPPHPGLVPTLFGMRLETRDDLPDDWDFLIQYRKPEPELEPEPEPELEPVRHGRWVYEIETDMFQCSCCNGMATRNDYPFCHWCGARMDLKEDDTDD